MSKPNKFRYITYENDGTAIYHTDPYDVYITLDEGHVYNFDASFVSDVIIHFTGMIDRKGKPIFEGDIIEACSQGAKATGEVKRRIDGMWVMYPAWQEGVTWTLAPNQDGSTDVEIIGNIYEHPYLIDRGGDHEED